MYDNKFDWILLQFFDISTPNKLKYTFPPLSLHPLPSNRFDYPFFSPPQNRVGALTIPAPEPNHPVQPLSPSLLPQFNLNELKRTGDYLRTCKITGGDAIKISLFRFTMAINAIDR